MDKGDRDLQTEDTNMNTEPTDSFYDNYFYRRSPSHKSRKKSRTHSHEKSSNDDRPLDHSEMSAHPFSKDASQQQETLHCSTLTSESLSTTADYVTAAELKSASISEKEANRLNYESIIDSMDVARLQEELNNLMDPLRNGSQVHLYSELSSTTKMDEDSNRDTDILSTNSRYQFRQNSGANRCMANQVGQFNLASSAPANGPFVANGHGDASEFSVEEERADELLNQGFVKYLGNYVAEGVVEMGRTLKSSELLAKLVEAGKVGGKRALNALHSIQLPIEHLESNVDRAPTIQYHIETTPPQSSTFANGELKTEIPNQAKKELKTIQYTIEEMSPGPKMQSNSSKLVLCILKVDEYIYRLIILY